MKRCPKCGHALTKPRSPEHHRRLFALIGAAYKTWPEAADFQPTDSEQLRAYLAVKCGHYTLSVIDPGVFGLSVVKSSGYSFAFPKDGHIHVYTPKSMAWDKLDQRSFSKVADDIEAAIEHYIGRPADEILEGEKEAA